MSGALHVDVVGSGPPLVLLHGWGMHGGVFAPLAAQLQDRFTLHVVDLPGHGLSRDSSVAMTLDAGVDAILRQVPDAPWCGWSLGGLFALQAALRAPERVCALVMLCASPRFVRGDPASADPWRYGVSPEIFEDFARGLRGDYRARDAVRLLRNQLFARGEPPAEALARGLELLQTTDLRAALPRLRVPSLWLAGRRDRLVDPRAMRQAAEAAPDARFAQIEHGGHAPFVTDADEVAAAIETFLSEAARG